MFKLRFSAIFLLVSQMAFSNNFEKSGFDKPVADSSTEKSVQVTKNFGKGKLSLIGSSKLGQNSSFSGEYSWSRVSDRVSLQFFIDKIDGAGDSALEVELSSLDIPYPSSSMFETCRKRAGYFFKDFAYGTSSIIHKDSVETPTSLLILTTKNLSACPDNKDVPKNLRLYSPVFPENARMVGQITYISQPDNDK